MSKFITILMTKLFAKQVGTDQFGNRYFLHYSRNAEGDLIRSVLYNGEAEPTKIPPLWHGWIHYMTDEIPTEVSEKYKWMKEHEPNATMSKYAYFPKGSPKSLGKRAKANGDFEAWKP